MAYTTNGIPAVHNSYYLAPAANGQTVVAATPVSYELKSAIPEMRKPIAPIGAAVVIGFALDGYPIYGGRDANGGVITLSQLDACNGITSTTPEFAAATYHYVLPIGVTTSQSSISCFHGTVSATVAAAARKLACRMPA